MKNDSKLRQKYHPIGTERKRGKIDTLNTYMYIYNYMLTFLTWYWQFNKSGRVKLVLWSQIPLCEIIRSCVIHMWIQFQPFYISGWEALWWSGIWKKYYYILKSVHVIQCISERIFISCNATIKVIIFWLENGIFEFSRKQYIFLKHSKLEFCAEFYYYF
jgi:hypothetical protein